MDGQNYVDWIRGTSVADEPARPTEEMQQEISRRIGAKRWMHTYKDSEGRMGWAAMLRHMQGLAPHLRLTQWRKPSSSLSQQQKLEAINKTSVPLTFHG